jgi:hypothetical protein
MKTPALNVATQMVPFGLIAISVRSYLLARPRWCTVQVGSAGRAVGVGTPGLVMKPKANVFPGLLVEPDTVAGVVKA